MLSESDFFCIIIYYTFMYGELLFIYLFIIVIIIIILKESLCTLGTCDIYHRPKHSRRLMLLFKM